MTTSRYLSHFFSAYLECALWSTHDESTPDGGEPMDSNYGVEDIDETCMENMIRECGEFIDANRADLDSLSAAQAGHDFWLTRNGHGAGFWDRGLGEVGKRLSKACEPYGSCDLYVGDDGKIYASGDERKATS